MTIKHVQSVCAVIEYDGTFVDHSREDTLTFIDDLIEINRQRITKTHKSPSL